LQITFTSLYYNGVLATIDFIRPSVCPSVCHSMVSCQNDSSYDHGVFTI